MSASSWYKDFTRRLDSLNTRVSQAPSNSASIYDVARVNLGDFDPYAKLTGGRNPQGVGEHVLDWGGKALDIISRPGYATGGVLNAILENKGGQVDVGKELLEGITGKDKRFFEPAQLIDPHKEGDSGFETAGKWVIDFLSAVATDPVSYIPGAVIAKPFKFMADAAGIGKKLKASNKGVDEFDALRTAEKGNNLDETFTSFGEISDKPFQLPKELTAIAHESPYKGKFTMPEYNGPTGPIRSEPKTPLQIEGPPRVGQVDEVPEGFIGPQGPAMPAPIVTPKPDNFEATMELAAEFAGHLRKPAGLSERDYLQVLQLVRDSVSQSLRGVKGKFNASEIKSPWRTEDIKTELPTAPVRPDIPEPVAPSAAGPSFESSVYANAYKRHVADTAKQLPDDASALKYSVKHPDEDVFVPETGNFYWGGQQQNMDNFLRDPNLNEVGDLSTQEGLLKWLTEENPNARVHVAGKFGGTAMPLAQYIQMFAGGKLPKGEIKVRGKSIPISKYVESQKAKWEARAKGSSPEEFAAYEKAVADRTAKMSEYEKAEKLYEEALFASPATKTIKPSRQDLENLLRTNKIVLSKEEKKRLLNSANLGEKSFTGSLAKLAEQERRLNLESLDELVDMVKSGRVDKSVLDGIYSKLGVSTLGQAKKKLEAMDNSIQRLIDKDVLRTQKELADASRKLERPASEGGFNPSVVGEVPREVPDPKIPVQEVSQTQGKTPSVSQAEAAVDRATTPDIAAMLDEEAKNRVWIAAKKAVVWEWDNWKKKYPHKTTRGAGRTDTAPGAGQAHWYGEYNAKKQYTFFRSAINSVQHAAKGADANLGGMSGAAIKYEKVMPMLKAHDDLLRTYGIHPSLVPGGGYPLSLFDVLSILPRPWVERHFFNPGRQVTVDQILHIAQAAVDTKLIKAGPTEWGDELTHVATDLSGFAETVRGILGSRWSDKNVGAKAEDFAQAIGEKAGKRELTKTSKKHGFDEANPPANFVSDARITGDNVAKKTFNRGTLGPVVSEDFIKAVQEKVAYNSARAEIQYGRFVKQASQKQVDQFINAVKAAKTNDEVFKVVEGARKSVNSTLDDTATIVPTRAAADEVKDSVEFATANPTTEIAAKQMAANATATTALKAAQAEQEVSRAFDDLLENVVRTETFDLGERAQMGLMARLVHSVAPHIAEGDLRKIMLNNNVTAGHITDQYSRQLSNFQRAVGTEKANQLFNDVRLGHKPNNADAAAYGEIQKIISRIFDDGDTTGWSLAGNGIHPSHLNSNLKHFQVHENFRLPTSGTKEEIYSAWRNFEANDPMDLLSRYHAAVQKTIAEKNLGAQISNNFGSARYRPGLVRVKAVKGSRLGHLINTDLYYPKDVVQNMFALEQTLKELAAPNNTNKLLRLFDSATHSYKAGLTIYRPGHHMRNLYGDIWLGAMDGVYSPRFYKRAHSVMATRKEHYKDYNFDASLSDLSGRNGTAVTMKVGGNDLHLSNDDVYRLAAKHGLLPNYATGEDLGVGSKTGEVGETLKKISPFGGKVHNVAADVSEYRDHWVRIAHFIKLLEDSRNIKGARNMGRQAQLNALDEVAARASSRVQKWHPNGSDNTKFERNVLRRGVLFYSWIRKAIPLVVETAVLHPGRFLAFPKAMYTLAESNGIDLNGFTDPFPTDQLFPSWLGGNQGPQFGDSGDGYIGMRMGVPMMDILDQYFTDPGHTFQTVMGATNPTIKVPFELATGSTTQGIPVDDIPKYLLGQVPFGNFANTMVGKPIGGVSPSDEGYDPGGIRDPKALATINLLTGLGLMDMSKPSYIKSGEFDVKYGRQGGG